MLHEVLLNPVCYALVRELATSIDTFVVWRSFVDL